MGRELPSQVLCEKLPGAGLRYVFPPRPLGKMRWLGLFFVVFGSVFAGGPVLGLSGEIGDWPFGLIFLIFLLPFVAAGLFSVLLGLYVIWGHSEVEIGDGVLRAVESVGPIRWRRTRTVEQVRRLNVQSAPIKVNSQTITQGPLADLAVLIAECQGAKRLILAPAYPREWLLALADGLAGSDQIESLSVSDRDERREVEVVESTFEADAAEEEAVEQPAGTRIRAESGPNGLTVTVPPAGVWRGSKGLFFFALLWCGFMVVFTSIWFGADKKSDTPNEIIPILFVAGFWAVGIGLMLGAINMGRRRAVIGVRGDALLILRKGIFGEKRKKWKRDEIRAIRSGPSGMRVNDRPVYELQIHPRQGKKFGLLSSHSRQEQRWIASLLRQALDVPARPQP